MLDCQRGKRNLSMAWIDVRKAYDSVDHDWLCAMTDVHSLPIWPGEAIRKLCASWNTRVVATTRQGRETSRKIRFMKGLPQGDALCPRLFTLCLNPVAWRLRATEGYRLSKPIGGSQWGGGFYGYRLKFWLFYGYRLIFFSYG